MKVMIDAEHLQEAAANADLDANHDLRLDYSGRGMYGDECVGIVGDSGDLIRFVVAMLAVASEYDLDIDDETFSRPREDSMGLSTIYYWPSIQADGHAS